MNFIRLLPVFISFLLLSAHFVRATQPVLVLAPLFLLLLLLLRKPWVPWVMQIALLLGAVEWLYSLILIVQMRIEFGMPWIRLALILGSVAVFTALSSLVFMNRSLRKRYSEMKNKNPE